jgi:hypothetical protein
MLGALEAGGLGIDACAIFSGLVVMFKSDVV